MKVLVIVYDGSTLPGEVVRSMVSSASHFMANNSNTIVKQFNEDDLVSIGVKSAVDNIVFDKKNDEVEHAATYIQTRFGGFFKESVKLVLAMAEVKNSGTEESTILKNAISIIVNNSKDPILGLHSITPSVVKVIKEFNSSYHV